MNRICFYLLAFLLPASSCKKLSELTQFNLKYASETTIAAGPASALPFDVNTPEMESGTESEFEGRKTNKNLVQSIKLRELKLKIKDAGTRRFDFLNSIRIYLKAEGEEEILIAWKESIPDTVGDELILDCADSDLKKHLFREQFGLRLQVRTDKVINSDVKIAVQSVFRVDANILGL